MKTWLLLDCNYLCHRAYHAMGQLSHNGDATAVAFGFFKDILQFRQMFQTKHVIFCWDMGAGKRAQSYPGYKASRAAKYEAMTKDEQAGVQEFRAQVAALPGLLCECGFANVHWANGYEADDVIASNCLTLPEDDKAIIITADKDMYQLLASHIVVYHPQSKKQVTAQSFRNEWGLDPRDWVHVKAIAGCGTDDVAGIKGIGEKTAAKYMRGDLCNTTKAARAINSSRGQALWVNNRRLVRLPYKGCPTFKLAKDELTKEKWNAVMAKLGIRVLRWREERGILAGRGFF